MKRCFHRKYRGAARTLKSPLRASVSPCWMSISVPELRQHALIVRPARLDPHPDLEKNIAAEHAFHVAPRRGRDRLHTRTAFAQKDRTLARLLHENGGVNAAQIGFVRKGVDGHRRGIRQLVPQQPENFFPQVLGPEKSPVTVGRAARRIKYQPWRQPAGGL